MASISDYLKQILSARYGKDVRQSIHDAIQQCYYDGKAGSIDLEARQSIEDLDNNKLDKTGDSANNTVTFTSGDSTSPTGWADIVKVASGETHASLLRKFSLAVKNLRYLYKMLGSTDISSISDGTVTGILSFLKSSLDTTNSNLLKCHINGDANIEMLYFKWSGVVKAGQTVNFGDFTANIPDGKSFFGLFLTPKCTIHISMSYYDNCIFAYSESFTGEIYYDVLMIVG